MLETGWYSVGTSTRPFFTLYMIVGVGYRGVKKGHVFKYHSGIAQFVRNLFLRILVPNLLKSDKNSEGAAIFRNIGVGYLPATGN